MKIDRYGQHVFTEEEVFDVLNKLPDSVEKPGPFLIENPMHDLSRTNLLVGYNALVSYVDNGLSVEEFDRICQTDWWMPDEYKELDIAKYILDLCENEVELQRCGRELLMYQERGLFDLLRYLKYLVDLMELNNIVWGVGRGSSVASFILYKMKVHRINSIYYDLDPGEFLR
jgi:hypothetical protein